MRLQITLILMIIISLLSSCAAQVYSYLEDAKLDNQRNNKVIFIKSLDTFLISSELGGFADEIIRKGDPVRLKYLIDGRKIAIVNRGAHTGTAMIYNFKSDRGILLDEKLCSVGKLFVFTPTPLGDDSFLIENNKQKTRFFTSIPKPCFSLDKN